MGTKPSKTFIRAVTLGFVPSLMGDGTVMMAKPEVKDFGKAER
jgi:hypothetical protein